jgi:hypothetical protein
MRLDATKCAVARQACTRSCTRTLGLPIDLSGSNLARPLGLDDTVEVVAARQNEPHDVTVGDALPRSKIVSPAFGAASDS